MTRLIHVNFRIANLLIPGDPLELELTMPSGAWTLTRDPNFQRSRAAMRENKCDETYLLTTDAPYQAEDAVHQDLISFCLAASYLTGLSATISREAPMSDMAMLQISQHFPRVRAMGEGEPAVRDDAEFVARLEAFANGFAATSQTEKSRLLIHHWIDALACWSFEDLVLSVTTILEIIAATSDTIAGRSKEAKHAVSLKEAAARCGIPELGPDFRNMRNDLVHRGTLSAKTFPNKTREDCSTAIAEALHWIDLYIHASHGLGPLSVERFKPRTFWGLNAFSLD